MWRRDPLATFFPRTLSCIAAVATTVVISGCSKGAPAVATTPEPVEAPATKVTAVITHDTSAHGWVGVYSFDELWEAEGQEIQNIITYELDVQQQGGTLLAEFSADGYMTSIHAYCTAIADDEHLVVLFKESGEGNTFDQVGEGDTLFTLVRKGDGVLTFWGRMVPQATAMEDGTPYFKKDGAPEPRP